LEPPPFVGIPAPTNAPTIAAMVLAIKNLLSKPRITIIGTMRHTASAKRICGPIPLAEPVRKTIAAQPPPTKIAAISVAGVPWWAWGGGILGIVYGLAVVFLAQRMGAATLIATVVTGKLICSVVVDHFALVGFQPHRASPLRITGCALMIAGLTLIAKL
jgi:hypothetical protein